MYAVIRDGSQQFRVTQGDVIEVERRDLEPGSTYHFDVLAVIKDGQTQIGAPTVDGASVSGEVVAQVKQKKLIVFKFRRRKGSQTKNGHRQQKTRIRITEISA